MGSSRFYNTTTCPHFTSAPPSCPASRSPRALSIPLTRSKAGHGFNCKFKPVSFCFSCCGGWGWGNRHLQCGRRLPPPSDLSFTSSNSSSTYRQFCCLSAVPCCHSTAPSLSSLTGSCVCVCACERALGLNKQLLRYTHFQFTN